MSEWLPEILIVFMWACLLEILIPTKPPKWWMHDNDEEKDDDDGPLQ